MGTGTSSHSSHGDTLVMGTGTWVRSYNWKGTFECGISWSDTNGFMDYAQGETGGDGFKFIPPQVTAEIIKLRAMLAVGANATLYKVAGPKNIWKYPN